MTDTMISAGTRAVAPISEQTGFSPTGEVLRDIARGGISGAIVGIVVGGLGARLVMRLVAMLHPRCRWCAGLWPTNLQVIDY